MDAFPPDLRSEIGRMPSRFGAPILVTVALNTPEYWDGERECEVCMVVRRPNGRIEIEPGELLSIADALEALPDSESETLGERWSDWGRFRAVVHRVVYRALQSQSP